MTGTSEELKQAWIKAWVAYGFGDYDVAGKRFQFWLQRFNGERTRLSPYWSARMQTNCEQLLAEIARHIKPSRGRSTPLAEQQRLNSAFWAGRHLMVMLSRQDRTMEGTVPIVKPSPSGERLTTTAAPVRPAPATVQNRPAPARPAPVIPARPAPVAATPPPKPAKPAKPAAPARPAAPPAAPEPAQPPPAPVVATPATPAAPPPVEVASAPAVTAAAAAEADLTLDIGEELGDISLDDLDLSDLDTSDLDLGDLDLDEASLEEMDLGDLDMEGLEGLEDLDLDENLEDLDLGE